MNICGSRALCRSSCTLWATAGGNWRWRTGRSIGPGFKTNSICGQRESEAHCRSYFTLTQTHLQYHREGKHKHARTHARTQAHQYFRDTNMDFILNIWPLTASPLHMSQDKTHVFICVCCYSWWLPVSQSDHNRMSSKKSLAKDKSNNYVM